jgi:hypothetical protein
VGSLCLLAKLTFQWDIHSEAPDLFQHLSESNLVIFKGDLNHRKYCRSRLDVCTNTFAGKLTYDCHAPLDTPFNIAIGPLASEAGAPAVCSLRTIKSDVVVGIPSGVGEKLDEEEPGWKISGKYVSLSSGSMTAARMVAFD